MPDCRKPFPLISLCWRTSAVAGMALLCLFSGSTVFAQSPNPRGFTDEEYVGTILSRNLKTRQDASVDKIKLKVELEQVEKDLSGARSRMKTPDTKVNVIGGGTRTVSNESVRQSASEDAKRAETKIVTLTKQMLIADARVDEFDKARSRGFISIRNGEGQQIEISPLGFRNGELKFIKHEASGGDFASYSFPIDKIQYGSLVDVVKFLTQYAGEVRHSLDEMLKVNEKSFFERVSLLDFDINHPRRENTAFVGVGESPVVDEKLRNVQNQELKSYNADLRKSEMVECDAPVWDQLENAANGASLPALDWALAQRYLLSGSQKNISKARKYAERAARQGHSSAFLTLGNCYNENYLIQVGFKPGEISGCNYETARTWYLKSTEKGSPGALWELGLMYFWGLGMPANTKQGADYFREAALSSDPMYAPKACFMLGVLYYQGNGVVKDHEKSVYWLQTAVNMNPGCEAANKARSFLGKNTFDIKKN